MSTPLVSVFLPAYNYARFLPAAIDGALAQDWPAIEVIVVDDGSTDATPAVIAAYGERVRSVRRPNGGLNAATTTGIGLARGDFLTFLDADDTWRPDRVRLLAEALLAAPDAGLAYGDMELIDEQGRVTAPSFRRATGLPALSGDIQGILLARNIVSAGAMMVRASLRPLFEPIGPQAAWQDWWIAANMNLGADAGRLVELLRARGRVSPPAAEHGRAWERDGRRPRARARRVRRLAAPGRHRRRHRAGRAGVAIGGRAPRRCATRSPRWR